jgi:tetratricopeptide (TPR) repeat protein
MNDSWSLGTGREIPNMNGNREPTRSEADREVEMAFVRHKRGELRHAADVYRRVLAEYPDHSAALHYLGLVAQQAGDSNRAASLLERSIAIDPTDPRAHNHLGQVRVALDDKRGAAVCFERALLINPNHVDSLNNLANVVKMRDLRKAIALYRRVLELHPQAAFAAFNLAKALSEDNAFDEAEDLYMRAIRIDPAYFQARHSLGVLLEQKGRFAAAIEQYLAAQRVNPRHVSSLANLIAIRGYEPDAAAVSRAEDIAQRSAGSPDDRIKLHRGLGKHHDRVGAYARAFEHFAASKALMRQRTTPFRIDKVAAGVDRLIRAFSRESFAMHGSRGSHSARPIFIVGMPRSGTTLTEQILASHPQVFGAGELQEIPKIVKSLRPEYPECVATLDRETLQNLASGYLAAVEALAGADALRVTDKLPLNSMHLGMIAVLFPHAHVVHCRRDPLDVALSSFVELFELEHDYTTDLEDFGHYFLQHERLMEHWRSVLPLSIHEVCYEKLVSDPEASTRELLAHCGLQWASACLEFHHTERTVRTPSRWQVRQPIYQSSIGRWRHYAAHMRPLIALLQKSGHILETAAADSVMSTPSSAAASPAASSGPFRQATSGGVRARPNTVRLGPFATTPDGSGIADSSASPPIIEICGRENRILSLRSPIFIVAAPRSGSTLLFETLAASSQICTVGGEAHWLVEANPELRPGSSGVASNRLTAEHVTPAIRREIIEQLSRRMIDGAGHAAAPEGALTFLEKTPKNALRIPFFRRIFPDARFVFLWRDPRESLGSIMAAWRAGNWQTYRKLPGFAGPWSLLLPPGWESVDGKPLEDIAAFQWQAANSTILMDLAGIPRSHWTVVCYSDLVKAPAMSVQRLCDFAGMSMDADLAARLASPLPLSRYTQTPPNPDKWLMDEAAILRVLPGLRDTWDRLRALDQHPLRWTVSAP